MLNTGNGITSSTGPIIHFLCNIFSRGGKIKKRCDGELSNSVRYLEIQAVVEEHDGFHDGGEAEAEAVEGDHVPPAGHALPHT